MGTDDQFGPGIAGFELKHALMVMPGAYGVAQGREPCVLDESGIGSKLRSSNTTSIQRAYIVRVRSQMPLLYTQGLLHQIFDLGFNVLVWWEMCGLDETVIRVLSCIQHSHAIQFAEKDRRQQMVHSEWIVRMPSQHLVEVANR